MFLDQVDLTVIAGNGGNGAATFRREAHVPRGGPDGGDGGRGGSVYLVVDVGQTMLIDYRHRHHFRAQHGGPGQRSRRHGKNLVRQLDKMSEEELAARQAAAELSIKEMGVKQIERAITQLPAKELAELVTWLEDYHAQVWDKRIEEDLREAEGLDWITALRSDGIRKLVEQHTIQPGLFDQRDLAEVRRIVGPMGQREPSRDLNIVWVWGIDKLHEKETHEYAWVMDRYVNTLLPQVPRVTVAESMYFLIEGRHRHFHCLHHCHHLQGHQPQVCLH